MTFHRTLLSLAAALSCSTAIAATDCSASVAGMTIERAPDGPLLRVFLSGGGSFAVDGKDDAWSRQVTVFASLSKATGQSVVARYAESGVPCDNARDRRDLVSLTVRGDSTTAIATTPTATKSTSLAPTLLERK